MSSVNNANNNNNHTKLNDNLILNETTTAAGEAAANAKAGGNSNNTSNYSQQQQTQRMQQLSAGTAIQSGNHHQQQQRRSLLPPNNVALHHLQQQLIQQQQETQLAQQAGVASSSGATSTTNGNGIGSNHSNQLQTVATIHRSHSTQQQDAQEAISPTTTTAATGIPQQQLVAGGCLKSATAQQRRSLYHLQSLKSATTHTQLKAPVHSIPPRYQPPPQPSNGGILKHHHHQPTKSTAYSSNGGESTAIKAAPHLNLNYPPDIPQLSSVYIPKLSSVKAQGNSARYLQQRHHNQQQQQQEMLKFVRKPEQEHPSPNASVTSSGTTAQSGRLTVEQNRQLQSLINELRALKEQNQRLLDDNQELRDLCCFLDDDRQKGRKLAREWQRFGRYTASVMRQEVAAYQSKLRQLDDKQQELITDNLELKELCLYLDEERAHVAAAASAICGNCGASMRNALRDDGDGSSSSTNADETLGTTLRNYERQLPILSTTLNDQTLQYVRSLERRIQQLEGESTVDLLLPSNQRQQQQKEQPPTQKSALTQQQLQQQQNPAQHTTVMVEGGSNQLPLEPIAGRPEAVVRALQVLDVREQLERDRLGRSLAGSGGSALDQMDDSEKALVREMCNVVWRKLEGNPNNGPNALEPL